MSLPTNPPPGVELTIDNDIDRYIEVEAVEVIRDRVNRLIKFCIKSDNTILRRTNIDEYKQACMQKFSVFHCKYPTLFFMILENPTSFPMYRLNEFFAVKTLIDDKKISEKQANIGLGQKYFEEFGQSVVDNLNKKKSPDNDPDYDTVD